jgi:hypothetical protein
LRQDRPVSANGRLQAIVFVFVIQWMYFFVQNNKITAAGQQPDLTSTRHQKLLARELATMKLAQILLVLNPIPILTGSIDITDGFQAVGGRSIGACALSILPVVLDFALARRHQSEFAASELLQRSLAYNYSCICPSFSCLWVSADSETRAVIR